MRPSSPRHGSRDISTAAASCKFVAHQSAIIRSDGGLQPVPHVINRPAPSTKYMLLYICYTHVHIINADCFLQSSPGRGRPHTPPRRPLRPRRAIRQRERERDGHELPAPKPWPGTAQWARRSQRPWAAGHSRPPPRERGVNRCECADPAPAECEAPRPASAGVPTLAVL